MQPQQTPEKPIAMPKPVGVVPHPHPIDPSRPHGVSPVFSVRGFEYLLMGIALLVLATALGSIVSDLLAHMYDLTDDYFLSDFELSFSAAALVGFGVFSFLFMRLKRYEAANPDFGNDPSRRRAIQWVMRFAFIAVLLSLGALVFTLLKGTTAERLGLNEYKDWPFSLKLLTSLVQVIIYGVIFGYFWRDEHRNRSIG